MLPSSHSSARLTAMSSVRAATNSPNNEAVVRVWHATSSSAHPGPIETYCHQWLDESECERADRFRVMTSRNQHIVGRGMARHLLGQAAGSANVSPKSIEFCCLQHGKPAVKSPAEISTPFNIAHTDGLVLCGIGHAKHQLLGVDVERLERRTDPELATRYFSTPEIEYVQSFTDTARRKLAFLKVWTLKEAFIKAIGTGLNTPLSDFAFENIDDDSPTIRMLNAELESEHQWKFFSFHPRESFIAAIAVATDEPADGISMHLNSFDEVVAAHS